MAPVISLTKRLFTASKAKVSVKAIFLNRGSSRHVDTRRGFDSMFKNRCLISAKIFCPRERESELDAVVSCYNDLEIGITLDSDTYLSADVSLVAASNS